MTVQVPQLVLCGPTPKRKKERMRIWGSAWLLPLRTSGRKSSLFHPQPIDWLLQMCRLLLVMFTSSPWFCRLFPTIGFAFFEPVLNQLQKVNWFLLGPSNSKRYLVSALCLYAKSGNSCGGLNSEKLWCTWRCCAWELPLFGEVLCHRAAASVLELLEACGLGSWVDLLWFGCGWWYHSPEAGF